LNYDFLSSWERLTTEEPKPLAKTSAVAPQPDVFAQMPLTQTMKVERLRYMTEPLPHDVLVAGPIALTLYAAIDTTDTNWIVILKDVGPDVSVRTAREGEREVPDDLKERELTRGWLKASCRALDETRSRPWEPFHKLTRDSIAPITPGEIVGSSQDLSRCEAAVAPAPSNHSQGMSSDPIRQPPV
jgi:uncharacterized protein